MATITKYLRTCTHQVFGFENGRVKKPPPRQRSREIPFWTQYSILVRRRRRRRKKRRGRRVFKEYKGGGGRLRSIRRRMSRRRNPENLPFRRPTKVFMKEEEKEHSSLLFTST